MKTPRYLRNASRQLREGTSTPGWWNLAGSLFGVVLLIALLVAFLSSLTGPKVVALPPAIPAADTGTAAPTAPPSASASPTAAGGGMVSVPGPDGQARNVPAAAVTAATRALQASVSESDNAAQPWDGTPAPPVTGFTPSRAQWSPVYVSDVGVDTYTFAATVTSTDNPTQRQLVSRTVTGAGDTWKVRSSP